MEDSLEAVGLDEVVAIRPTVTARQRKLKSSTSVGTNNTNPPQKSTDKDGVRPSEKNGVHQASEVGSPRAKLLRDSPRFKKMALLSVNVDSEKRRDASVYDMVHTTESAESSLNDSLMDIAAELGTRPIDGQAVKRSRKKRKNLASDVKTKQAIITDVPTSDHTIVAAYADESLAELEPELGTRPVGSRAAKRSQKNSKSTASGVETKHAETADIPSSIHTTPGASMSDSFSDVEPMGEAERMTGIEEVTEQAKKGTKSRKPAKTDMSLPTCADNSQSKSKSSAAKKATKRANSRLGAKKRAAKDKRSLSIAVEQMWSTKTTSRLRPMQSRSTVSESLPNVQVNLSEEKEMTKLSPRVKRSSASAARKKRATKSINGSHSTQTVGTLPLTLESLPDEEVTLQEEKEVEKPDKQITRSSASVVVKTGKTSVRSSTRNRKLSPSNLEVDKSSQEPVKKTAKSSEPAVDQNKSSTVFVLPDSQTSKLRPNRKTGKLTKRSSNEVGRIADEMNLKSLEADSACNSVSLSDSHSRPALTSKDDGSNHTRLRNRRRQLSTGRSHQEKENRVERASVTSHDRSTAGQ